MDDDASTVTALALAARKGDQGAWKSLVDRYTPLVAAVILGFRLQRSDAEDVVQTVWLRLVEHLGDLREPRALPKWLVTTTRNECLRVVRAAQRLKPFDPTQAPTQVDRADGTEVDDHLLDVERHQVLLAAIAGLPDHQRDLLLLLMADPPVPYSEITERLGVPKGSIGPTRARALERLRESPVIDNWWRTGGAPGTKGGGQA
jgi:RNA polymerase sigma factor (sigma-70 family)